MVEILDIDHFGKNRVEVVVNELMFGGRGELVRRPPD